MNPVSTWGSTMVTTQGEILDFGTRKSPENAFSGIFTYLKLILKYYNFAIFQHMLCKTYDESLQKQAANMELQCILCIASSSYRSKTKRRSNLLYNMQCIRNTYWNFYKKTKIWEFFPKNGRFWDSTGGRETNSQNGSLPFKTGGLEQI